ncbi:hypothetical protein DOY81_002790 [Sarcophaga bullata]|nr:hypothetical protein DOY81_002790 [Sarcophaga bullata]
MLQYCLQATISFRLAQTEFEEAHKHVQEISDETIQCNADENVCSTTTHKNAINKISFESNDNSLDQIIL